MRRVLGTSLLVLFLGATAVRPGDGDDPRAIVAKAIKALGGEKKLKKHNAATWKEKGVYYGMGDGLPYTGAMAVQWPSQFRMEIEGVFTIVLDGATGWIKDGEGTRAMPKEQVEQQIMGHKAGWIATLLPLKDKAFTLTALDEATVDKRPALGVKVTRKDYPEVKLYFDKKSGLLLKAVYPAKEGNKEFVQEIFFQKYQPLDGVQVPRRILLHRDGKKFVEGEVVEFQALGKLDAKVFAKP